MEVATPKLSVYTVQCVLNLHDQDDMPQLTIRSDSVVASTDQISADLSGEAAIFNLKTILAEHDVATSQCMADIRAFIAGLAAEGLVDAKT